MSMTTKEMIAVMDQELACSLFDYNPHTGEILWLPRDLSTFKTSGAASVWSQRFSGRVAGTPDKHGYIMIRYQGKLYKAHRLAWLITHGEFPDEIDHINGNKSDNRLINLRSVARRDQLRNLSRRSDNSSGSNGVYYHKKNQRWCARIYVDGRYISLGCYATLESATKAREKANAEFGFHENHGRLPL